MFVVVGALGNVGREVVRELLAREVPVRAVVRDPAMALLPARCEVVGGDLGSPESLAGAFAGAEGAFLLPGYPGLARAAHRAGAGRVVQLSGGSAGSGDSTNAVTRYMRESEAEVREAGGTWTVLRPTAFMSNALRWRDQLAKGDLLRLPFAEVPLASVDPRDIASVAAVAMTEDGHAAMTYRPTGPQALLPREQVEVLARVLGRPLRFEAQSNDEARRQMLTQMPAEYVAAFLDFYVNGSVDESTVRPTVTDVTGVPPRTFHDWAVEHRDRFTGGGSSDVGQP